MRQTTFLLVAEEMAGKLERRAMILRDRGDELGSSAHAFESATEDTPENNARLERLTALAERATRNSQDLQARADVLRKLLLVWEDTEPESRRRP